MKGWSKGWSSVVALCTRCQLGGGLLTVVTALVDCLDRNQGQIILSQLAIHVSEQGC